MQDTRPPDGPDCDHGCDAGDAWVCTDHPECDCDCYPKSDWDDWRAGTRQPKRNYRRLNVDESLSVNFVDAPLGFIAAILQERANFTINVPVNRMQNLCTCKVKSRPFDEILKELNLTSL